MQIIYETERLILTPFNRDLIKETHSDYQKWFYDSEVTKYNSHGLFPYGKEKMESYLNMCESGKEDIVWAIVYKSDSSKHADYIHIGNISLQRINWIYRSAEFAIVIGNKDFWKYGIGFEALSLLFRHGFEKLNLHRIWTGTSATNIGMRQLATKLNMKNEGTFYDAIFLNGKYEDIYCYSITEEEWKKKKEL